MPGGGAAVWAWAWAGPLAALAGLALAGLARAAPLRRRGRPAGAAEPRGLPDPPPGPVAAVSGRGRWWLGAVALAAAAAALAGLIWTAPVSVASLRAMAASMSRVKTQLHRAEAFGDGDRTACKRPRGRALLGAYGPTGVSEGRWGLGHDPRSFLADAARVYALGAAEAAVLAQGLEHVFGFNVREARAHFRAVLELQAAGAGGGRECALCHWGEALTHAPHLNDEVLDDARWAAGRAAARRAVQVAAAGAAAGVKTDAERRFEAAETGLAAAMAERFGLAGAGAATALVLDAQAARDAAYARSLGRLCERFRHDATVCLFYAEVRAPWPRRLTGD